MNWKFSSAAIITLFVFTLNAQMTPAQSKVSPTASPTANSTAHVETVSSNAALRGHATIIVRVVDESGVPLKRQALVQLLSDGTASSLDTAITEKPSYAQFQAAEAQRYTIRASAAGYRTAELHLQTYKHDNYYQAVLQLHPEPDAQPEGGPALSPAATEEAEKGLTAFESDDFYEASKRFNKALELAPQNPDLNFLLGVSLFESHHLQEAQQFLQRATSLDPQHVPSLTALGRVRLQQREFNGAAAPLKKAISINPTAWGPHLLLGSVYLVRREFEAAVKQSREAIRLGQAAADGSGLLLGEALAAQGQRDEARQALTAFVKAAPDSPAAPAARRLLLRLAQNDPPANAELVETALISARSVPIANTAENGIPWHSWRPVGVDEETPPIATGMVCPEQTVLDNATKRVDQFVDDVNRFDATEQIVNQNLTASGRVISTQSRKFDYEVSISELNNGDLDVDEARDGTDAYSNFPDHIATLGLPSLALVFHEHYREGYVFDCEGLGEWNGQATWLMHFQQRADRVPRIRGYNINGVLYPVGLTGRAWITADSFQIVHMEADMVGPVPQIKLRYEHQAVDYGPVSFATGHAQLWVPKSASLYFDFEHHKFHRVHTYSNYLLFSVSASEKISPPKQRAKQVAMTQ